MQKAILFVIGKFIGALGWIGGVIGFLMILGVINKAGGGFWGFVIAFMLLPVTFVAAPLYALFKYGNWLILALNYGSGLLVALGFYLADKNKSDQSSIFRVIGPTAEKVSGIPKSPTESLVSHVQFSPNHVKLLENKILVMVDSQIEILQLYKEILGVPIHSFISTKEAIKFIESNKPDLLTTSLFNLDDGIEFIKSVRSKWNQVQLPILIISSFALKKEQLEPLGVNKQLFKPLTPDSLRREVLAFF